MSDLIRQTLGWGNGSWPPDFYALLGLIRGPADPDQVEAAVLDRMEKLRVFQLVHPESVTEAMNLLARALITLSDPIAKAQYDLDLPAEPLAIETKSVPVATSGEQRAEELPTPTSHSVSDSVTANPPPGPPPLPTTPFVLADESSEPLVTRQPTTFERSIGGEWNRPTPTTKPHSVRRKSRSTEPSLVRLVVQLRRLLDAWDEAGNWLAIPDLTFATRIEAVEVVLAFRQIARLAPAIIEPNGPGSAVINLAASRPNSTTLMDVTESTREQLARDWRKGRRLILDEYEKVRARMRRQSRRFRIRQPWQKTMATWALMAFAIATVLIVVVRSWRGV